MKMKVAEKSEETGVIHVGVLVGCGENKEGMPRSKFRNTGFFSQFCKPEKGNAIRENRPRFR